MPLFDGEGFSFSDVLDLINPLQHLPVISSLYRELTGDEIGAGARVLGSALFGGIPSVLNSLVNVVIEDETDKNFGEHVLALFDDSAGEASETAYAAVDRFNITPGTKGAQARNAALVTNTATATALAAAPSGAAPNPPALRRRLRAAVARRSPLRRRRGARCERQPGGGERGQCDLSPHRRARLLAHSGLRRAQPTRPTRTAQGLRRAGPAVGAGRGSRLVQLGVRGRFKRAQAPRKLASQWRQAAVAALIRCAQAACGAGRAPKIALPTRTLVAPVATAIS